jgi:hypothetical protein
VVAAILSGPEATALNQMSMADSVNHLYQKGALNRSADADGRDYWAGLGQQHGRAWLARVLADELEAIPTRPAGVRSLGPRVASSHHRARPHERSGRAARDHTVRTSTSQLIPAARLSRASAVSRVHPKTSA